MAPKIMIIDDCAFDREHCRRILQKLSIPHDILPFSNAEDAIACLSHNSLDGITMILLDVNLPGLSGIEFVERCCSQFGSGFSNLVVLMLGVELLDADAQHLAEIAPNLKFLDKPLPLEPLNSFLTTEQPTTLPTHGGLDLISSTALV